MDTKIPPPKWWTIDRVSDVYLIFLTGGGREQFQYYVLVVGDEPVIFNLHCTGGGDKETGFIHNYEVHDLRIPDTFKNKIDEIKNYISEGLK